MGRKDQVIFDAGEERRQWLIEEAKRLEISVAELLRRIIDKARGLA